MSIFIYVQFLNEWIIAKKKMQIGNFLSLLALCFYLLGSLDGMAINEKREQEGTFVKSIHMKNATSSRVT